MMAKRKRRKKSEPAVAVIEYDGLVGGISELLEQSRRTAARTINSILTTTYWEIGRRIVEFEQGGKARAEYGTELLKRLAADLTARHGRGFAWRNLFYMRKFCLEWEILQTPSAIFEAHVKLPTEPPSGERSICQAPFDISPILPTPSASSDAGESSVGDPETSAANIFQTPSGKSPIAQTPSAQFETTALLAAFPLSWSHYVRLMAVENLLARAFYEAEAIRGGWSVRQLDRQIGTQLFERTAKSKRQAAVLARARKPKPEDAMSVEDEVRDPYLLEFLDLRDEYSESELEEALIRHLETFLLELGAGFTFVARQKRIRIGNRWYRIDLLLYHRMLRCLVVIDLKIGSFSHADAGQMNLYLNYVKQHLTFDGETDPVGIILCSDKDDAVVQYALGGINARVFASKYMTQLPDEETLRKEIETTKQALLHRQFLRHDSKSK